MKYLSLFSGIGGFELGLLEVFPNSECLGFSEINKNALTVYARHFPEHKNLGNIEDIDFTQFAGQVDVVFGGSPCQDLSILNPNRKGLKGKKSGLFYEFARCLKDCRPTHFLLENVASMSRTNRDVISQILGVLPVKLNSANISAQIRNRLYWATFEISELPDSGDSLSSLLLPINRVQELKVSSSLEESLRGFYGSQKRMYRVSRASNEKSKPITCHFNIVIEDREKKEFIRKFHSTEVERLQGFPDNWTKGIAVTYQHICLGNAVNVQTVTWIFRCLKDSLKNKMG